MARRGLPYESKPGTGYLWTDKTIRPFDVLIDGSVKEYREGDAAYNQVKRGELKFVKVGEKNITPPPNNKKPTDARKSVKPNRDHAEA